MIKDSFLFGTKVLNRDTNEIYILIYTYENRFADKTLIYSCCIDSKGKKHYFEFDKLSPIEE